MLSCLGGAPPPREEKNNTLEPILQTEKLRLDQIKWLVSGGSRVLKWRILGRHILPFFQPAWVKLLYAWGGKKKSSRTIFCGTYLGKSLHESDSTTPSPQWHYQKIQSDRVGWFWTQVLHQGTLNRVSTHHINTDPTTKHKSSHKIRKRFGAFSLGLTFCRWLLAAAKWTLAKF